MAYPAPKIERIGDNIIRIHHPEVLEPKTYLTSASVATDTTITVKNNAGYSNTDPQDNLLFEGFGNEIAEIKRINGAITAGTSLTVQALTYAHGVGTSIYKILFDQFEVRGGTTAAIAGSTNGTIVQFNGSNTTPINLGGSYTDFVVTGTTYAYYGVRFYNSLATTTYYSSFSDGIPATDFTVNSVGFIRRNAFENTGESIDGELFSDLWVYDQIYTIEQDVTKELAFWSWLQEFEADMGNIATGDRSMSLPSDIEDNKTTKSIYGIRIGTGVNLEPITKREYEELMDGVPFTTLASTAAEGATSMTLTDSRDFADSGSVNIAGTSYTYTTNTRATNVLSGFSALAAEITSGVNVWQNITFGEPLQYCVYEGSVYWDTPPSSSFNGRNIWIDYYKTTPKRDSDTDTITVNDPNVVQLGLEMMIKKKKSRGTLPVNDPSIAEYVAAKGKLIKNEISGNMLKLVPRVPGRRFKKVFSWWK